MARLLDTVVALQKALDKLSELDESLAGVPPEMRELHDEYTARKAEIDALEATIGEAEAQRRAAEVSSQDCEVKLKHFQEQVARVRTQREYSAILQEIDTVRGEVRALEDQALAAMEQQEAAENELGALREDFADIDARYRVEAEKWEAARPGVEQRADSMRAQVAELREQLTPGSRMVFERLYERFGGDALAEVVSVARGIARSPEMWNCAACHYNVRPQSVVEIRNHGALVHCDNCKRLLYIEESTA